MAVINKQIAYMALPLSIRRGNPFPIDEYSVWYDKAAMDNYAQTSPVAYVGQILSLVNETETTVEAYMIQNTAGALIKLAATTASGDLTEDVLELQGKVSNLETSVGTKGEESTVTATDLWAAIDEVVAAYIAADAVIDGKFANYYNKTETEEYIDNKFSNLPNLDNIVTTESGMKIILPDSAINTPYQLILSEEVTQPALSSCTNLIINRGNSLIEIKWKDPDNIVSDNAATSEWKYTKVIRKINSQPVDINDGTEVVLSSIKNQYSENGFIDLDVDNEKEYYYGFFAINNDEISDRGVFIKADK